MNWFNFFKTKSKLRYPFGRSINANPAPNEEDLFNKSYEAFEKKDILNAYEYFLKSLKNYSGNTSNNNITIKKEKNKLTFEIYQGTARVNGYITKENLYAEVTMIKNASAHVALKRYLLERNYQLTYARYFNDEEYIKLKLYHNNITMSPQKIFFPLREISLNADFDKEYMKHEFPDIKLEDIRHLKNLNPNELKIKYDFLHKWINALENKITTLPSNDNEGMQAFAYLLIYFKIDYLLVPKYEIYQKTSKKVRDYFNDETSTTEAKNEKLKNYIEKLKKMSFKDFSTNFYNAKYTFNPTEKTTQEETGVFIDESLIKIRWYKNNRYSQIIPSIYKYIAFYLLYNYGLHSATKELLHTLVEIQNPSFFKALDYSLLYNEETSSFSKKAIILKIENIIISHQKRFKSLKPFGDKLDFTSLNDFNNSFYVQLKNLNFEEI